MSDLDFPIQLHVTGVQIRSHCEEDLTRVVCRDLLYVDTILDKMKIELVSDVRSRFSNSITRHRCSDPITLRGRSHQSRMPGLALCRHNSGQDENRTRERCPISIFQFNYTSPVFRSDHIARKISPESYAGTCSMSTQFWTR